MRPNGRRSFSFLGLFYFLSTVSISFFSHSSYPKALSFYLLIFLGTLSAIRECLVRTPRKKRLGICL